MNIIVNGKRFEFEKEINLSDLLIFLNIDEKKCVIELNKEIIKDYNIKLSNGDKIEIIRMVGGG
ncbi:MAG TPA: sulfur carrier protein ThiS [Spirochaetota bacterium]|nr:sulfur carrier protein ThiS [Spirochaetota bacterium]HOM38422.1 sulfur carrier protein ThiS [Spirochaetota bacterium]HPQ48961.1 sulfur carrier protein ThiS [Spirochaetota bacterium]